MRSCWRRGCQTFLERNLHHIIFGAIIIAIILANRFLPRLMVYLLTKRVVRIVIGTLLLVGGLIFGITSHIVPYQHLTEQSPGVLFPHINAQDDGNVYIQDFSHPGTFYIIHEAGILAHPLVLIPFRIMLVSLL